MFLIWIITLTWKCEILKSLCIEQPIYLIITCMLLYNVCRIENFLKRMIFWLSTLFTHLRVIGFVMFRILEYVIWKTMGNHVTLWFICLLKNKIYLLWGFQILGETIVQWIELVFILLTEHQLPNQTFLKLSFLLEICSGSQYGSNYWKYMNIMLVTYTGNLLLC